MILRPLPWVWWGFSEYRLAQRSTRKGNSPGLQEI
jgi:hypothetical protein